MCKLKEKKNANIAILWDWLLFLYICNSKPALKSQLSVRTHINSCLQSAMGMFSALPHKKNLCHNDICPPEQEGSQPLGLHICSFHFIELQCSAPLNCSLSGLTKPALDDQRLTWIQNVKRKPAEGRARSDPILAARGNFTCELATA